MSYFLLPNYIKIYLMKFKQITFLLTLLADRANCNFDFFLATGHYQPHYAQAVRTVHFMIN